MEREARYTAVGAFVILVTTMAALFVYWYSEGRDRRSYVPYEIYFRGSVTGLSEGGSVRYLGVEVGKVRSIQLDPRSATRVQVVVEIDQQTPVSERTTAELSSLSLATGLLYIDLRQNTGNREVLPAVPSDHYPVINTVSSNFDSFLNSLPELAGSVAVLLQRAQEIFSPANSTALADMVKNLHTASARLPRTMQGADTLLQDLDLASTEARKLVASLQNATNELARTYCGSPNDSTPRPTTLTRPVPASTASSTRIVVRWPVSRRTGCRRCSAWSRRRATRLPSSASCRAA